jgi:hypothetical protein
VRKRFHDRTAYIHRRRHREHIAGDSVLIRQLYNTIRPHETLAGARPIERYLADPDDTSIATSVNAPKRADSLTRDSLLAQLLPLVPTQAAAMNPTKSY